jgi:hypothetical protein
MAGVQGMVRSRPTSDAHKDAILRSKIENRLQNHFDGKKRLSPSQLKAGEILYARLRPVLSAVEQTVTDARDSLTEDQLLAQLCAIFAAKPELYKRVVEVHSAAALVHESGAMLSEIQRSSLSEQGTAAATQRGVPAAPAPGPERVGVEPPKKNA